MATGSGTGTPATTVTYNDNLSASRDKVRFNIGDTVSGSGPRPSDGNFTDDEIAGLISIEGTWQRAVAGAMERLAREWTRHATFAADGLKLNRSDIAKGWREEAAAWRKRFGYTVPIKVAGQINQDAYSDDVTNDDMRTSSDYEGQWEYVTPKA